MRTFRILFVFALFALLILQIACGGGEQTNQTPTPTNDQDQTATTTEDNGTTRDATAPVEETPVDAIPVEEAPVTPAGTVVGGNWPEDITVPPTYIIQGEVITDDQHRLVMTATSPEMFSWKTDEYFKTLPGWAVNFDLYPNMLTDASAHCFYYNGSRSLEMVQEIGEGNISIITLTYTAGSPEPTEPTE